MFLLKIIFLFIFNVSAKEANLEFCNSVAANLQEGDLIFLDIDSSIFEQVANATQTWTSHVGIALYDEEGWKVAESALVVSHLSPLCKYLGKTQDQRYAIRRLKTNISSEKMAELKVYLGTQMGIFYDTGFNYDSSRLFCSKLVYQAFQNVLGVEVGKIKTLQTVLAENPEGSTTFWKFWFLGSIPWERRTVTPKDQLIDEDFVTVISSEE